MSVCRSRWSSTDAVRPLYTRAFTRPIDSGEPARKRSASARAATGERLGRHDLGHESQVVGLLRTDELAGVEQSQGGGHADEPRQEPCPGAGVGHQAAVDEVPGESRVRRGDAHITLRREFRAHPDRGSVDRRDHGLRTRDERPPAVRVACFAPQRPALARHGRQVRQVGAGTERPGHARQDHHVRGIVLTSAPDRVG